MLAELATVIWISLDGVRADYLDRDPLPAFGRVAAEGVRAEHLAPVFPSSTFPNHVSLATCATVERHGIVANSFVDREKGLFDYANDASWIDAEPLWAAAERQGARAATYFWVGSETPWQGVAATYRKAPFDAGVPDSEKVDQILAWLDLPPETRPRLVMTWWHGADHEGHLYGPDAPEVHAAMKEEDAQLARLLAGIDARGAWGRTTVFLSSDHGMARQGESADPMVPLAAEGIRGRFISGGPFGFVILDDRARAADAAAAIDALPSVEAWPSDAVPESFHYRRPGRTGDVFVLAEAPLRLGGGSLMLDLRYALGDLFGRTQGAHGYDPARYPEMNGIFLAMGRGAPAGTRLPPVRALDVAPTAARLLGIDPPRDCEGAPIAGVAPPQDPVDPQRGPIAPPPAQ
jgi:predicted AlkP superfamily pyrophosphatase or phosphodiesterase